MNEENKNPKRMANYLGHAGALIICLAFVYFMGSLLNAWKIDPWLQGFDSVNHLYKTQYILNYWPHHEWNYQWSGGMPQFLWYPPLYYYLIALIVLVTRQSVEVATVIFLATGFCIFTIGCYGFLWKTTSDKYLSTACTILTVSSPVVWASYTTGGVLSRQASLFVLPLSFWMLAEYADDLKKHKPRNVSLSMLVLSLATALAFHPFFGVITIALSLITLVAVVKGFGEKNRSLIKIVLPVVFLNAFFLIPYVVSGGLPGSYPGASLGTFFQTWSAPNLLLPLPRNVSLDVSLNWVLSPLSAVLIVLGLLKGWFRAASDGLAKVFLLFIFFATCFVALGPVVKFELTMLVLAMAILPFLLASLDGIILARLFPSPAWWKKLLAVIVVCLAVTSTITAFSVNFTNLAETLTPRLKPAKGTLPFAMDETTMFRAGVSGEDGFLGMWFNYVSQIPQTRDYHSAAVLQPDWHAWLMHGVWKEQGNYPETDFLLDWWSVKWLLINSYEHNPAKFLSKPERYKPVTNATLLSGAVTFYEFLCENVTPIVSAGNQPTLLVIGKGQYRSALNILAYSDYDSERLIPVHGHDFVDDYSLDELQKFDAILLIGQQYHNRDRSWDLLRRYVEAGGGLIVETGIQFLTDDWNASSFPDAFPVSQTIWGNFGKEWKFSYTRSEISEGIRFDSFSPAISGEDPWSYSRSSNESVRSWAKAILLNNGYPVVVAGQLGKGRIVWSGMNLYFHIGVYKNNEEIKFAVRMIDWVTRAQEYKTDNALYRAGRVNPERVEVQLDGPSKGVLYKEFYFGNWRAFLTEMNGKTYEVAIYKAGPDFMYVFVPRNASYPVKAVFEYHRELQYGGLIVSMGAFLLIVGYAIGGDKFTRMLAPALRFRSRSKSWETRSVRTGNSATSKKRS